MDVEVVGDDAIRAVAGKLDFIAATREALRLVAAVLAALGWCRGCPNRATQRDVKRATT